MLHLVFYVLDMETVRRDAGRDRRAGDLDRLAGACCAWCRRRWPATMPRCALLGRNWKRVQRLAYPAAVLTLIHWVLVHDGTGLSAGSFRAANPAPGVCAWPDTFVPTHHRKENCMILRILPDCRRARDRRSPPQPRRGDRQDDLRRAASAVEEHRRSSQASLKKQGWQVRKSKVDGGCYEVYGTDPKAIASRPISTRSASRSCWSRAAARCCSAPNRRAALEAPR